MSLTTHTYIHLFITIICFMYIKSLYLCYFFKKTNCIHEPWEKLYYVNLEFLKDILIQTLIKCVPSDVLSSKVK